jgi:hypothetical protein
MYRLHAFNLHDFHTIISGTVSLQLPREDAKMWIITYKRSTYSAKVPAVPNFSCPKLKLHENLYSVMHT